MSIGSLIKRFFHALFGSDIWKAFAHATEDLLKQQAGQLAIEAVTFAAGIATDPTAKHNAAFSKLMIDTKTAGLQITTSMANTLLELALQKIKGSLDHGLPDTTP